jgi:hypothetical protein
LALKIFFHGVEKFVEGGTPTNGDVVNFATGLIIGQGRQDVGLNGVVDIAIVAAGLTIAVNVLVDIISILIS